jgi:hypothetical protein
MGRRRDEPSNEVTISRRRLRHKQTRQDTKRRTRARATNVMGRAIKQWWQRCHCTRDNQPNGTTTRWGTYRVRHDERGSKHITRCDEMNVTACTIAINNDDGDDDAIRRDNQPRGKQSCREGDGESSEARCTTQDANAT